MSTPTLTQTQEAEDPLCHGGSLQPPVEGHVHRRKIDFHFSVSGKANCYAAEETKKDSKWKESPKSIKVCFSYLSTILSCGLLAYLDSIGCLISQNLAATFDLSPRGAANARMQSNEWM